MSFINERLNSFRSSGEGMTESEILKFDLQLKYNSLSEAQSIVDSYDQAKRDIEIIGKEIKKIDPDGSISKQMIDDQIEKLKKISKDGNMFMSEEMRKRVESAVSAKISIPVVEYPIVNVKNQTIKIEPVLSASEALYGFCGWLTSRKEIIKMGSSEVCDCLLYTSPSPRD